MPRLRFGFRLNISLKFDTMLIKYDRLGSLGYTTNLLKDGCLACICPSYDKDTEMRTFLLEHCNRFCIYINNQNVTFGMVLGCNYALTHLRQVFQYSQPSLIVC